MPQDPDSEITPDDIAQLDPEKGDSVFDQFSPERALAVEGPDGLAMDRDPPHSYDDALPPPLTPQTMNCLAQPADEAAGRPMPLPECKWYKRQRYSSASTPGATQIDRYCTHPSQRGLNGACTILRDAAIYQCELRIPGDPAGVIVLDAIDDSKIQMGIARLAAEASKRQAIEAGEEAVRDRGKPGVARRYRMFRTPEDVKAGRTVLNPDDYEKPAETKEKPQEDGEDPGPT